MNPRAELLERGRLGIERSRRTNAMVCVVIGALFALFALGCFVVATASMVTGTPPLDTAPAIVFGLFWCALTALLLGLGLRGLGRVRRGERLRASGMRGKATVLSYTESKLVVDGETKFQLALRIDIEGRPPWDVSLNEGVPRRGRIHTGATLPVLVSPVDQTELMIDWYAGPEA